MIAAVSTCFNEADICGKSYRHLLLEGVDRIYVAHGPSTDGTGDVLATMAAIYPGRVRVFDDNDNHHFQPALMNALAAVAYREGHEWILPVDADEFWYATSGETIAATLAGLPESTRKLHVRQFLHRDWSHVYRNVYTLGKVAYRWEPESWISNGNHDVWLPSGSPATAAVLDIRELQFRSYEHMARKCRERVERLDPSLPQSDGAHQKRLFVMSEPELRAEWSRMMSAPVLFDPIPVRS